MHVLVTGGAGFIGSNLVKALYKKYTEGLQVVVIDNMNDNYDICLKEARVKEWSEFPDFTFVKGNIADKELVNQLFRQYQPQLVVNLAAQAGVRYSITNPDAYIESNLIGFYNILEACRHSYEQYEGGVQHLVYASSSSVYGSNKKVPYSTDDKVDNPVSLYAATKKSNELIKKIEGFASRYEAQELQRQVFVSNRIKAMNESIYYAVDYIHDAINRDAKIAFQYFIWDEHKQKKLRHDGKIYLISPWALTWDDENYYMIGYDSDENKIKHYRVDKMTKIQPTEEKRDGAEFFADFDMALYSKQTFGMYGGREETVTLRCENKLANVMIDKFCFDTAFSNITDTHFDMRVKVFVSPVFLTWIMNFGADVTVLSPESVKDELTALASDVLA